MSASSESKVENSSTRILWASSVVYRAVDLPMGANKSYHGRPFSWPSAFPLARRYCRNLGMYSSIAPSMASKVSRFMSDFSSVRSRGDA